MSAGSAWHTTRASRRGFTVLEVTVVIALLGLVMGALMLVVVRQQRFYRDAGLRMDSRSQIRQASMILPGDLRGISPVGGDILALADSAVEVRATYGSAVICDRIAADAMAFAPAGRLSAGSGNILTSFLTPPDVGDTLFVYDTAAPAVESPWKAHRVAAVSVTTDARVCGVLSGYTAAGDASKSRVVVTVTPALAAAESKGSPVRFTRRVRYNIYQAGDDTWYLGYNQRVNDAWVGLQPVSGPYRAYTGDTLTSGLTLRYYAADGAEITAMADAARIARVRLWIRARKGPAAEDYLTLTVAIRNRT